MHDLHAALVKFAKLLSTFVAKICTPIAIYENPECSMCSAILGLECKMIPHNCVFKMFNYWSINWLTLDCIYLKGRICKVLTYTYTYMYMCAYICTYNVCETVTLIKIMNIFLILKDFLMPLCKPSILISLPPTTIPGHPQICLMPL